MLKQMTACVLMTGAALLGAANTASAQQTLNINLGYFAVLGADSRTGANCSNCGTDVDVLVANRDFLTFNISEFNSFTFGGEYLVPLGQFFEAGAGISYAQSTVPSVYTDYVNTNGTEIDQELKLRLLPMDFTFRVLPLKQTSPLQPYFGVGLSVVNWHYSETGQFIDFSNGGRTVYCARDEAGCDPPYEADGTDTGPVILGGLRFAGATFTAGGEVRYRQAKGSLSSDFAGDRIDLGGWTYQGTFGFRFGR